MENLSFIPESYIKKQEQHKIRTYKTSVLVLWILCLALYIVYTINRNYFNTSNENAKQSTIEEDTSAKILNKKSFTSINTLSKLLETQENKLDYTTAAIENKRIDMEIILKDKSQYYEIIHFIENKAKYKILYLSSPVEYEENLKFKISLEVT